MMTSVIKERQASTLHTCITINSFNCNRPLYDYNMVYKSYVRQNIKLQRSKLYLAAMYEQFLAEISGAQLMALVH